LFFSERMLSLLIFYFLLLVKYVNKIIKIFAKNKKLILIFVGILLSVFLILLLLRNPEEKINETPWDILQVPKDASNKMVRRQARTLAKPL
jgi:hypothetical protein